MNDEMGVLLKGAEDALDDATLLIEHNRNEAAANRLYYSVYYCIQALLQSQNIISKTHKGTHIQFQEAFIKSKIFPELISQHVQDLFNLIQKRDYELEQVPDNVIQQAKTIAEEVLRGTV